MSAFPIAQTIDYHAAYRPLPIGSFDVSVSAPSWCADAAPAAVVNGGVISANRSDCFFAGSTGRARAG